MPHETSESWYTRPIANLTAQFGTDVQQGLTCQEAAQYLQQGGPNEIRNEQAVSALTLLAGQFGNLVIGVLNGLIGFFQEYRAEQAVAALARLTAPRARVVRDGHAEIVAATEVVRGDLLLLDAGDLVAADVRLVALHSLPPLQVLFGTTPLSLVRSVAWLMLGSVPLLALELRKVLQRSSARRVRL